MFLSQPRLAAQQRPPAPPSRSRSRRSRLCAPATVTPLERQASGRADPTQHRGRLRRRRRRLYISPPASSSRPSPSSSSAAKEATAAWASHSRPARSFPAAGAPPAVHRAAARVLDLVLVLELDLTLDLVPAPRRPRSSSTTIVSVRPAATRILLCNTSLHVALGRCPSWCRCCAAVTSTIAVTVPHARASSMPTFGSRRLAVSPTCVLGPCRCPFPTLKTITCSRA